MNKSLTLALAGTLLAASATASAGIASTSVNPGLSIASGCSVDTSGLHGNLGSHALSAGVDQYAIVPETSIGTFSVLCSDGVIYAFGIGGGENGDGSNLYLRGVDPYAWSLLDYWVTYGGVLVGDAGLAAIDAAYSEGYNRPAVTGLVGDATVQSYELSAEVTFSSTVFGPGLHSDTNTLTVVWP